MRALFSGAVLATLVAGAAQATEPSMSFYYSMLQGVSTQDCLQRGRNALTANQFQLEWWQRYNGGRHWKGWINGQWVKQPNTGYSDAVNGIFQQVEAGTPPAGWND